MFYYRKFVNLNSEHNHMLLKSDLTLNLVHDIHRMPELFKFQVRETHRLEYNFKDFYAHVNLPCK